MTWQTPSIPNLQDIPPARKCGPMLSAVIAGVVMVLVCGGACFGALVASGLQVSDTSDIWFRGLLAGMIPSVILSFGFASAVYSLRKRQLHGEATIRKAAEITAASEAQLATLLDAAPIGLCIVSLTKGVVRSNKAYQTLSGLNGENSLGNNWAKALHPDDLERVRDGWFAAAAKGEPFSCEKRYVHPDGSVRWIDCRAEPVIQDGRVTSYVVACVDISERLKTEQALRLFNVQLVTTKRSLETQTQELAAKTALIETARREAERANLAKSDFLANMSHEIRTPMTAILGYGDMLLDPNQTTAERAECIHTIRRCGHHLLALINDILDLSKIEAGRMQPELIECSPGGLIQEVASLLRGKALEKGIAFGVEFATPIPDRIITDPTRLKQVLTNLVGNAIKFTESGGVRIVAQLGTAADGSDLLQVDVIDTGIGIKPSLLAGLFEPFKQADESMTRRFGGTGLGLAICKNLAEILGGTITVESKTDEGSTFTLTVAAGKVAGSTMVTDAMELRSSRRARTFGNPATEARKLVGRVLLAEDGIDNQRLLGTLLRRAGADLVIVENGALAIDAANAALAEGRPFGVILMDMQMPVLDGYSAASRLRAEGYTGPIVALTAHAMAADRERCIRAGCDDYMTKPIEKTLLIDTVDAWLTGRVDRTSGRAAA